MQIGDSLFGRYISPPSSGLKSKPSKLSSLILKMEVVFLNVELSKLCGLMTHKTIFFIVTAVRSSNPTSPLLLSVTITNI
jgi:hypothetical protein